MLRPLFFRLLLCLQTCSLICITPLFSQTVKSSINGPALPVINNKNNNTSNNNPQSTTIPSKPSIDTTAIFNWPKLNNNCSISPNGNYILYKISNYPRGKNTLVVQSTNDTSWKKQIVDANAVCFSADEKQAVYSNRDTLFFLQLGTGEIKTITGVQAYQQPRVDNGTWLAYQLKTDAKDVVLLNLITGQEQRFTSAEDYSISDNAKALLIKQSDQTITTLKWVNLEDKKATTIWSGQKDMQLTAYNFDLQGEQLVFMVKNNTGNSIWYYKNGMEKAIEKVNEKTEGIATGLQIASDAPFFNKGGKYIFFKLQKPLEKPKQDPNAVQVDVWSYTDIVLQSEQPRQLMPESFTSVIGIDANKVIHVKQEGEGIMTAGQMLQYNINCDYLVVRENKQSFFWSGNNSLPYYLISLQDGSRKLLRNDWIQYFIYSPAGKFIIYYDAKQGHFISYEVATGLLRNITKGIPKKLFSEYSVYISGKAPSFPIGIGGWLKNDEALLIYDNYDIWKIDPVGKLAPINITNGTGEKNHIKFKVLYEDNILRETAYSSNDQILLTAFNTKTKGNGIYKKNINEKSDPELLTNGPYLIYRSNSQISDGDTFDGGMEPLKADNKSVWLIKKQSATQAPNYYLTNDFRSFKQITNLQPQKAYNWLTTELINYKQLDGTMSQGVLYKPENFDSSKKYPVIFSYYETFSYRLNEYPKPDLARARIDIPWYVSRGYLVFTPDIHYSIASISGKVAGDDAVNSVVGAAKYLSKLLYVDAKRIGIQGHSFAGYETNYLITHSNVFAAACEMAGTSNVISAYLGFIIANGKVEGDKQSGYEIGQGRIGATLWERPDLYIKYSPVFKADAVKTPLLIVHNLGDRSIDWQNGVQMYMALRRLQKPVWLLQYDNEGHQILNNKKALDFTIRMQQFFDHYLKGSAPSKWMTIGVPAALKGIESRLELDVSNDSF